jgi:hypothetical protein
MDSLSLTFDEVSDLMSAIVDCDQTLYQKLDKFVNEQKTVIERKNLAKKLFDENFNIIVYNIREKQIINFDSKQIGNIDIADENVIRFSIFDHNVCVWVIYFNIFTKRIIKIC